MIIIYIIIAFLIGIVFFQWLIPLGDNLINLFLTLLEVQKNRLIVKITQSQKQIAQIKKELDEKQISAIGFTIGEEEDSYD